jgi:hypothetical protein
MNFKVTLLRSTAIASVFGAALAANAVFIDPLKLQTTTDAPIASNNVQALLNSNGFTSSVGTTIPNYGDQVDFEVYDLIQQGATWKILWQVATNAPTHKLGFYTNIGAGVINPGDITWVLGDLDNDRDPGDLITTSAPIFLNQTFGLAFFTSSLDGSNAQTFFSQTFRNADSDPDAKDHAATIRAFPVPSGFDEAVVSTWEDSLNNTIDEDYNDFGTLISGVRPVPEPATMAALGLGVVALLRRRSKK